MNSLNAQHNKDSAARPSKGNPYSYVAACELWALLAIGHWVSHALLVGMSLDSHKWRQCRAPLQGFKQGVTCRRLKSQIYIKSDLVMDLGGITAPRSSQI